MRLTELRKAQDFTQESLASDMDTTQGQVSRIERQTDLKLSTLRRYVEGLGGRLEVIASFPGGVIYTLDVTKVESESVVAVEAE